MVRKKSPLEKRFGKRGKKGDDGEKWLFRILNESEQFDEVKDFTKEYKMQELGIDGSVFKKSWYKPYYFDCKHNLIKEGKIYKLCFEMTKWGSGKPGWFYTSNSDRIYHVSVKHKTSIFYDLKQMRKRIREQLDLENIKIIHRQKRESLLIIKHNDPAFKDLLRFQY